jgi:tRNA A37 N6-isopentenylltransferase MiaA
VFKELYNNFGFVQTIIKESEKKQFTNANKTAKETFKSKTYNLEESNSRLQKRIDKKVSLDVKDLFEEVQSIRTTKRSAYRLHNRKFR